MKQAIADSDLLPHSGKAGRPRVVLADDHLGVLRETRSLLDRDFDIVAEAHDGSRLVAAVSETKPDGVVADLQMPGLTGIEAGRTIIRDGLCPSVIILSMYDDPHFVREALDAGVRGYVLKEDAGEELGDALWAVLSGGRYLSRGVARRLPEGAESELPL